MIPDIKHFPVNWVDGMKISSKDFIMLETAAQEGLRDAQATRLNTYSYGLIPTNNSEIDNYPKLVYNYTNGLLQLKECRAITLGGLRIEITEANHERRKSPVQLPSVAVPLQEAGRYDVYVHIDTSARVGAGDFATNNPPRYSSVLPKYELSVRQQDGSYIEQENFLKISELEVRDGRVEILTANGLYIPPCTTVNALSSLKRLHGIGEERLKALLGHYSNLINRMGIDTMNEVAKEAVELSEKIVTPLVSSLSYYQYILPDLPPVHTVVYFKDYARTVKFHLDRPYRAEIINKFKNDLLALILNLEKAEIKHWAIRPVFDRMIRLMDELDTFLAEVSRYNYDTRGYVTHDLNQLLPGQKPPILVPAPEPARPMPQPQPVEVKKPSRFF